jgi:hypothetical protein
MVIQLALVVQVDPLAQSQFLLPLDLRLHPAMNLTLVLLKQPSLQLVEIQHHQLQRLANHHLLLAVLILALLQRRLHFHPLQARHQPDLATQYPHQVH